MATFIVCLVLVLLIALAGRSMWKTHKNGGCCGGCSGCSQSCHCEHSKK